jgi:hypothetical protein
MSAAPCPRCSAGAAEHWPRDRSTHWEVDLGRKTGIEGIQARSDEGTILLGANVMMFASLITFVFILFVWLVFFKFKCLSSPRGGAFSACSLPPTYSSSSSLACASKRTREGRASNWRAGRRSYLHERRRLRCPSENLDPHALVVQLALPHAILMRRAMPPPSNHHSRVARTSICLARYVVVGTMPIAFCRCALHKAAAHPTIFNQATVPQP